MNSIPTNHTNKSPETPWRYQTGKFDSLFKQWIKRAMMFIVFLSVSSLNASASSTADECAYNLAIIDAGGSVSKNSEEVARLTQLVAGLSRLTKEEPQTIGDCAVVTQEYLEKQGVKVSSYRLLTETYNTLRGVPAGTVTFKDALALVATILSSK